MKTVFTLTSKELKELFSSPVAYVFMTTFLFLVFWLFFSNFFVVGQASLRYFFDWFPLLFIVFLPAITMARWSEEKRSGTHELLLTLPVSETTLVLGKFFACVIILVCTLILTIPLVITTSFLGDLDTGQSLAAYLGVFLMGITYLSLGLFISALTKNQVIAFLFTVVILFVLYIINEPFVTAYAPKTLIPYLQYTSLSYHFEAMMRGVLDSRDIVFFLSLTGVFLYSNTACLVAHRVRFSKG
ncbi:ABC transporter permease [bacterium]|nr:ABC transporter permease [bacterium]MBU1917531.1 ABC transporter permease [bacterium]